MRKLAEEFGFDFEQCLKVVATPYRPIHQHSLSDIFPSFRAREAGQSGWHKDDLSNLLQPLGQRQQAVMVDTPFGTEIARHGKEWGAPNQ